MPASLPQPPDTHSSSVPARQPLRTQGLETEVLAYTGLDADLRASRDFQVTCLKRVLRKTQGSRLPLLLECQRQPAGSPTPSSRYREAPASRVLAKRRDPGR